MSLSRWLSLRETVDKQMKEFGYFVQIHDRTDNWSYDALKRRLDRLFSMHNRYSIRHMFRTLRWGLLRSLEVYQSGNGQREVV